MKEAIILAGGYGTRLKQVISDVPKPMALIDNTPFLEILLNDLEEKGFLRVIICVGYKSEKIINYFGNKFKNIILEYTVEEKPLGTGGAIKKALNICKEDYVYVLNGDSFLEIPKNIFNKNLKNKNELTVLSRNVSDTSRYGVIKEKDNKIYEFHYNNEISGPGLISAGIYILSKNILDSYKTNSFFSFELDCLPDIIKNNIVYTYKSSDYFIDIGIPKDYIKAQDELKRFL